MRNRIKSVPAPIPVDELLLTGEWLMTEDVMKLLRCGISTLKNLRRKKLLPFSKIGGLIYYNAADVQQMLVLARRLSLSMIVSVFVV